MAWFPICGRTSDQREEFNNTDVNPRLGFFTVIQILIELAAEKKKPGGDTKKV